MTKRGFTLVEIMIVVAIIALLAAIAIPNLLRARLDANEAAVVEALKTVSTQSGTWAKNHDYHWPALLSDMTPTGMAAAGELGPPYLDDTFFVLPCTRNGYTITYNPVDGNGDGFFDGFYATAFPIAVGMTGSRTFYVDDAGTVCAAPQTTAVAGQHWLGACPPAPYSPMQ